VVTFAKRQEEISSRYLQGGCHSGEDSGEDGDGYGKDHDSGIDRCFIKSWKSVGTERPENGNRPVGNQQSGGGPEESEENGLGQKLPNDA
jgi:hypothetical protein